MKPLIVSYSDREGGAAIAAYRLLQGLISAGTSARMLVAKKLTRDPHVLVAVPDPASAASSKYAAQFFQVELQQRHIDENRTALSDTLFSFPYPSLDVSQLPVMRDADLVNFHWINGMLSPAAMRRVIDRGIPAVWSLHDMWPFTGGCHYSAGCAGFADSCSGCPQLRSNHIGLTEAMLRDKIACFPPGQLTVVALSRWMQRQAQSSALFRDHRIELIHNGLDTALFHPHGRESARRALGLPDDALVLMFGATHGRSRRKGFDLLAAAIRCLKDDPRFSEQLAGRPLVVLSLGHPSPDLESLPVQVCNVGYRHGDEEIAGVYRAADVFVLPSREDNLPNTVMEAMACGCVPVAFDVGGTGDLFSDGVEGVLVDPFDTSRLAEGLKHLLVCADARRSAATAAVQRVRQNFTLEHQANRYQQLYRDLTRSEAGEFSSGLRPRYAAPVLPYPSPAFSGTGGAFYRVLLFSYYARLSGQVQNTPTKTLLFIVARRLYRRAAESRLTGPLLRGMRKLAERTPLYAAARRRMASGVKETD